MNKIVSNITIICNNLILKYVEEDIVLSVNVKTVTLQSVNELWQPTFTGKCYVIIFPEISFSSLFRIKFDLCCLLQLIYANFIKCYLC